VDLDKQQNDCSLAELHNTSNLVHNIDPQIDAEDPDSDNDGELSLSPLWYRFRPSTATIEGTGTGLEQDAAMLRKSRTFFVIVIENFMRFLARNILTVRSITGLGSDLGARPCIAQGQGAQSLISQFEASCEAQRETRKHPGPTNRIELKPQDGIQRKRRGRPRDKL
jgi:hypothetical protein